MESRSDRSLRGLKSKSTGELFEEKIIFAEMFYRNRDLCFIQKTPEPMHVLKSIKGKPGRFEACFEKQAQPDFRGILCDGSTIIFDAKHTDTDRITRQVVTGEQEKCLDIHEKYGAHCFIIISIKFEHYYRVPWNVFRDMKEHFGHKYMNEQELGPYELKNTNGILRFLDGIEIAEKGNE